MDRNGQKLAELTRKGQRGAKTTPKITRNGQQRAEGAHDRIGNGDVATGLAQAGGAQCSVLFPSLCADTRHRAARLCRCEGAIVPNTRVQAELRHGDPRRLQIQFHKDVRRVSSALGRPYPLPGITGIVRSPNTVGSSVHCATRIPSENRQASRRMNGRQLAQYSNRFGFDCDRPIGLQAFQPLWLIQDPRKETGTFKCTHAQQGFKVSRVIR